MITTLIRAGDAVLYSTPSAYYTVLSTAVFTRQVGPCQSLTSEVILQVKSLSGFTKHEAVPLTDINLQTMLITTPLI